MSSNDRSKFRLTVISRYSVSRMARMSPSRSMLAPVLVLMLRMIDLSEALDRCRGVGVDFHELVRSRQRQHRLHAALQTGELERGPCRRRLPVQIHQAPDRGAVEVLHAAEIDDDFPRSFCDFAGHHRRK